MLYSICGGAKRDKTRFWSLETTSPIMVLSLNRFAINFANMNRFKVNTRFAFPLVFEVGALKHIERAFNEEEQEGAGTDTGSAVTDRPTDKDAMASGIRNNMIWVEQLKTSKGEAEARRRYRRLRERCPPEDVYELYAIVIHSGGAYSGHYHAYIKDFHAGMPQSLATSGGVSALKPKTTEEADATKIIEDGEEPNKQPTTGETRKNPTPANVANVNTDQPQTTPALQSRRKRSNSNNGAGVGTSTGTGKGIQQGTNTSQAEMKRRGTRQGRGRDQDQSRGRTQGKGKGKDGDAAGSPTLDPLALLRDIVQLQAGHKCNISALGVLVQKRTR